MPNDSAPDWASLLPVFNVLPDPYLLLSPELVIEAASNAYLAANSTLGRPLAGNAPNIAIDVLDTLIVPWVSTTSDTVMSCSAAVVPARSSPPARPGSRPPLR